MPNIIQCYSSDHASWLQHHFKLGCFCSGSHGTISLQSVWSLSSRQGAVKSSLPVFKWQVQKSWDSVMLVVVVCFGLTELHMWVFCVLCQSVSSSCKPTMQPLLCLTCLWGILYVCCPSLPVLTDCSETASYHYSSFHNDTTYAL